MRYGLNGEIELLSISRGATLVGLEYCAISNEEIVTILDV
jgi:hypothetical protein